MAWNRDHAGLAATPAVAIEWSVKAMAEAADRLTAAGPGDLTHLSASVGETVWWVTLVDATLVRYHPRDYERALADKNVKRRKTEETLEGLRYVRNQLGKSLTPPRSSSGPAATAQGGRGVRSLTPGSGNSDRGRASGR